MTEFLAFLGAISLGYCLGVIFGTTHRVKRVIVRCFAKYFSLGVRGSITTIFELAAKHFEEQITNSCFQERQRWLDSMDIPLAGCDVRGAHQELWLKLYRKKVHWEIARSVERGVSKDAPEEVVTAFRQLCSQLREL